jgi:hypothetical protein
MVSKFGSAPIELEDRQIAARNGKWWIQLEVQLLKLVVKGKLR